MAKKSVSKSLTTKKPTKKTVVSKPLWEQQAEQDEAAVLQQFDRPPPDFSGGKHLIVKARAGTGKTFTMILSIVYAVSKFSKGLMDVVNRQLGFVVRPSAQQQAIWDFIATVKPSKVMYVAFNSSIVKDFSAKWSWLVTLLNLHNVELTFSTIHSLGYKIVASKYRLRWGDTKRDRVRTLLCDYWKLTKEQVWEKKREEAECIEKLVGLCKLNLLYNQVQDGVDNLRLVVTPQMIEQLMNQYDIDQVKSPTELAPVVTDILNICRTNVEQIDFNDQIWLPVVNNLQVPKIPLMIVDEGQDLNPCQQALVMKAGHRIALVGDEAQAIYAFAGADSESISRMEKRLAETEQGVDCLKLTETRRCGKQIVSLARQLVPDFEAHESNPEGEILTMGYEQVKDDLKVGDMLLCRVNAPLIELAFKLIRAGKKAKIQGRDLGKDLKWMVKRSKTTTVEDFLQWIEQYTEREVTRLRKRNADESQILVKVDMLECFQALCDGAISLEQLNQNIDLVFSHSEEEEKEMQGKVILLSSIHRSKGLEANRVFIHRPDLLPHPMAKTQVAKEQEKNLMYVAQTRALNTLVYVTKL